MSLGTATGPNKSKTSLNLGDETLLGTQLEVISELQGGTVTSKFQITSAIGLNQNDFDTLFDHFKNDRMSDAIGVLKTAAGNDDTFKAVLDAVTPGLHAPGNPPVMTGKGGFPNLRCIVDFGRKSPTQTFQIHTILDFTTTDGPGKLQNALPRKDFTEINRLVADHCEIFDGPRVTAMLAAALT